jgi:hypothetical protein
MGIRFQDMVGLNGDNIAGIFILTLCISLCLFGLSFFYCVDPDLDMNLHTSNIKFNFRTIVNDVIYRRNYLLYCYCVKPFGIHRQLVLNSLQMFASAHALGSAVCYLCNHHD